MRGVRLAPRAWAIRAAAPTARGGPRFSCCGYCVAFPAATVAPFALLVIVIAAFVSSLIVIDRYCFLLGCRCFLLDCHCRRLGLLLVCRSSRSCPCRESARADRSQLPRTWWPDQTDRSPAPRRNPRGTRNHPDRTSDPSGG